MLGSWVGHPREIEAMLAVLAVGILALSARNIVALIRVGGVRETWVDAPRWLGAAALLLATFGLVLGLDMFVMKPEFLPESWEEVHAGLERSLLVFSVGSAICGAGFISSWVTECLAGRRG